MKSGKATCSPRREADKIKLVYPGVCARRGIGRIAHLSVEAAMERAGIVARIVVQIEIDPAGATLCSAVHSRLTS